MKKYLIEAIGAFFWVFLLVLADVAGNREWTPIALGAGIAALTLAGAALSGAHYNPAFSVAALIRLRITRVEAPYYLLAQIVAGILASWIAVFLLRCQGYTDAPLFRGDPVCSIVGECIGSFALTFVFLQGMPAPGKPAGAGQSLAVGLALIGLTTALRPISGGILNPAAALGLAFSEMLNWSDIWVYLLGPFLGAAAAGSLHQWIHQSPASQLPEIPQDQD